MAADAARAKRLDDKHEQILREMLKLPGNKKCFDCTQKVSRSRSLEILATWLVLTHARSLARPLALVWILAQQQGPLYVCLDYNTFVCSACSGVQYVSNSILRPCLLTAS